MSRNLGFPLLILLTISMGTLLYFNTCSVCAVSDTLSSNNQRVTISTLGNSPDNFTHELQLVFPNGEVSNSRANFVFGFSSPGFDLPIDENINPVILEMRKFLAENPDQRVHIQGYFRPDESNPTAFSNLGLARANQIKKYLFKQEIPSHQTRLSGQLMDSLNLSFGKIWGAVTWRLEKIPADIGLKMDSIQNTYRNSALVIPFDNERQGLQLTHQHKESFTQLMAYLDWNEEAILEIVGHSDDTGSDEESNRLGLKRAEAIKRYLMENGISSSRINTFSAGHSQPMATNRTIEGRNLNKRVEIKL